MRCLCEFRFHWTSWILSRNPVGVLTSQHGQSLPTGKFQAPGREKVQRAEHHGSGSSYHNDSTHVDRAPRACRMSGLKGGGGRYTVATAGQRSEGKPELVHPELRVEGSSSLLPTPNSKLLEHARRAEWI